MKKLFIFLCALAFVFSVVGSASASTITNGSFESFFGWDAIGNASTQYSSFGSGPTHGVAQALITTGTGSVSASSLETFLGLTPGMLNFLGNGIATAGSAIKQDISAQAGDIIAFDWNFLTNETSPTVPPYVPDFAFYSIAPVAIELADAFDPLVGSSTSFNGETGYSTHAFTFSATGTYTLGFGVVHGGGDTLYDSALLVDNVSAVPVPPALLLLGSGLAGLAVLRRSRESRT